MDLKEKVTEVVEEFCDSLTTFTSLDVSSRVKQGGFESTRHRDIAYVVRILYVEGLMEDYGYERAMIDVQVAGTTKQAYAYHHQSVNPEEYKRRSQVAIPPVIVPPVATITSHDQCCRPRAPVISPTPTRVDSHSVSQVRKQKGDCRLELPPSWVKQLGWVEGTTVYAVHENHILLKSPSNIGTHDRILATATVVDGRLRVPKTAFEKAGFQSASGINHEVVLEVDHISVKDA